MLEHLYIGLLILLMGLVLRFLPPKNRNAIYGYRSRRSFSSQESWDFANRYSGGWGIVMGLISIGIGIVTYTLGYSHLIAVIAGTILLIGVIPITEERLRKKRYG